PLPPRHHTLSLHDALPIFLDRQSNRRKTAPCVLAFGGRRRSRARGRRSIARARFVLPAKVQTSVGPPSIDSSIAHDQPDPRARRSEEHTSELQSRENLVCR